MWYPAVPQLRQRAQQRENGPQRQHNSGGARAEHGRSTGGARVEHGWSTGGARVEDVAWAWKGKAHLSISKRSARPRLRTVSRKTASAIGLRQMFPAREQWGRAPQGHRQSREGQGGVEEQATARRAGDGAKSRQWAGMKGSCKGSY